MSPEQTPVYLHRIGTRVPEQSYTQEFALRFLLGLQGGDERVARFLTRIYQGTAIEKRHTVIDDYGKDPAAFTFYPPSADLKPEPSTARRNERFVREADRLSEAAVRDLLDRLPGFDPALVTHLVTVSCTGFSAPGFDFHLVKSLPLRADVQRFHLGFMGCYAAFPALRLARHICLSEPAGAGAGGPRGAVQRALPAEARPGHAGGRGAVRRRGRRRRWSRPGRRTAAGPRFLLHRFASRLLPDSEREMAWTIGDTGFDMKLTAYVPRLHPAEHPPHRGGPAAPGGHQPGARSRCGPSIPAARRSSSGWSRPWSWTATACSPPGTCCASTAT